MPDLWLPGIPRVDTGRGLNMRGTGERVFTWHTMEGAGISTRSAVWGAELMQRMKVDPTFVFNPVLGGLVQMLPMDKGCWTLRYKDASGSSATNVHGTIHGQVEVMAEAAHPFTDQLSRRGLDDLTTLINFLRSWGIPDRWCGDVAPPKYPGAGVTRFMPKSGESGHTGHAMWRRNDHGDPGAIAAPWALLKEDKPVTKPEPTPDKPAVLRPGSEGPDVKDWQQTLNGLGADLKADGEFGPNTATATRRLQRIANLKTDTVVGPNTRAAADRARGQKPLSGTRQPSAA